MILYIGEEGSQSGSSNDATQTLNDLFGISNNDSLFEGGGSDHSSIGANNDSNAKGEGIGDDVDDQFVNEEVHREDPEHAKLKDFSVVRRSVCRNKYALLTCDKGGKVGCSSSSNKRSGCTARFRAQ
ncbi:hypothetical protein GOBAR_AA01764 [Gossypium barbadense]|uniref:Uncharacterized protein n=1 Tax=Gossypium barbadense TaxID=3634 RepID=A0A2P5YTA4_GOSBA|nr:hypothetical protein GOBAR_AA01764 [Gossypium barbadense]